MFQPLYCILRRSRLKTEKVKPYKPSYLCKSIHITHPFIHLTSQVKAFVIIILSLKSVFNRSEGNEKSLFVNT